MVSHALFSFRAKNIDSCGLGEFEFSCEATTRMSEVRATVHVSTNPFFSLRPETECSKHIIPDQSEQCCVMNPIQNVHKSRMSSVDTAWPNGEKSQMPGTLDPQNE